MEEICLERNGCCNHAHFHVCEECYSGPHFCHCEIDAEDCASAIFGNCEKKEVTETSVVFKK